MMNTAEFWEQAKKISNDSEFEELAIRLFQYQRRSVSVYNRFTDALKLELDSIESIKEIPLLPIEVFKKHIVLDSNRVPELVFLSSGTTGEDHSRHYVRNEAIYRESVLTNFRHFYGDPGQYVFIFLLPSYIEQGNSSLVFMANILLEKNTEKYSGFYLSDYDKIYNILKEVYEDGKKIFLMGVSFALIDLFNLYTLDIPDALIMETGGMKGRRKELVRDELHEFIKSKTGVLNVHSEYGMTELFSQAYALRDGLFNCPPWMKIFTHDIYDPYSLTKVNQSGTIGIIDLANIHSCAFVASRDIGRINTYGQIEILGRIDNSDVRGCNLMVQ